MSIAAAQAKYSFGLKGDVASNVWYLDEQSIIYPGGSKPHHLQCRPESAKVHLRQFLAVKE